MHTSFALHPIHDVSALTFDPAEYSLFKHGHAAIGPEDGVALAESLVARYGAAIMAAAKDGIVVLPSPYAHIPTAVQSLMTGFMSHLNQWLVANNLPVAEESKVWRTVTYRVDYGMMDKAERLRLIQNDQFYVDKTYLQGKLLLFIDDIKITGSHEYVILKTIKAYNLENAFFLLYFADLLDPNAQPQFEHYINQYSINGLDDLEPILAAGHFKFNTRVVKLILGTALPLAVAFLERRTDVFVRELYDLSLGNSYHQFPEYHACLAYCKERLTAQVPAEVQV